MSSLAMGLLMVAVLLTREIPDITISIHAITLTEVGRFISSVPFKYCPRKV